MQPPTVGLRVIHRMSAIVLLSLAAGCSQTEPPQTTALPTPSTTATSSPQSPAPAKPSPSATPSAIASPQSDPLPEAIDIAMGAATIAQSAILPDDWKLVANQWQQAIALLKSVPASHPQKALAQKKIAEYQSNLAYANQQVVNSAKSAASTLVASQPTVPQPTTPQPAPPGSGIPSQPLKTSVPSGADSANVALASHLKGIGAKMYATFWCGVCRRQEQEFGAEALRLLNIIECDPRGKNAQPTLCRQANISAYPTWEIKGQFYQGGMSLETLADLSGYQGSRNFSN